MELKRGRVVHVIPGRVRIKLNQEELTEEFNRELRSTLLAMSGVEDIQITPRTGSVVIHCDPTELDVAGLRRVMWVDGTRPPSAKKECPASSCRGGRAPDDAARGPVRARVRAD